MVRDVCTSMMVHSRYPNKKERIAVAKLLVQKYPFLADAPLCDKSVPWVGPNSTIFKNIADIWLRKSQTRHNYIAIM